MDFSNLFKAAKSVGGFLTAAGVTTAGIQTVLASDPKVGKYVAVAGAAIHGAATFKNELPGLISQGKAVWQAVKRITSRNGTQPQKPPIPGA